MPTGGINPVADNWCETIQHVTILAQSMLLDFLHVISTELHSSDPLSVWARMIGPLMARFGSKPNVDSPREHRTFLSGTGASEPNLVLTLAAPPSFASATVP